MANNDETIFITSINDQATEEQSWIACLVILQGANAGDRILLNKDEITIGDSRLKFISSDNPEQSYYDELYRQTHMDKVLRIYNKQHFLTKLDEEITSCRRYDHELSLILFDVDHFKRLNDTYGHLAGDAALVQLAGLVKNNIRDTGILCRYGGEEFTIIMPHTNSLQAHVLAEHIRKLVAKTPVNHDNISIAMTISLGITSYKSNSTHPCTRELLIAQADKALYQAVVPTNQCRW